MVSPIVRPALLLLVLLAGGCRAQPQTPATPSPSPAPQTTMQIFLSSGDPNDCSAVTPVDRSVAGGPDVEKAMRALMAGPTSDEKARGLGGWFDDQTRDMLNSAAIAGGVARVDFKDLRPVIPNASSSCGSAQLLAQLDSTAKQTGEANRALYSINGDAGAFYEWLQLPVPDA